MSQTINYLEHQAEINKAELIKEKAGRLKTEVKLVKSEADLIKEKAGRLKSEVKLLKSEVKLLKSDAEVLDLKNQPEEATKRRQQAADLQIKANERQKELNKFLRENQVN